MRNKILLSTLLLSGISFAQIGVGNDLPHESAILHIGNETNNNKGLLIPNVALKGLTDKSVIAGENPKEGLIIFNTAENDEFTKGFYYWGTTRKDDNGPVFEWNKLVGNNELKTTISENQLILDLFQANVEDETTAGFNLKNGETEVGKFNETLTRFTVEKKFIHELHKIIPQDEDPESTEAPVDGDKIIFLPAASEDEILPEDKVPTGYRYIGTTSTDSFIYTNELGVEKVFTLKSVMASSETLTELQLALDYNGQGPALIYRDEEQKENVLFLKQILEQTETLTKLEFDQSKDLLIYTDEESNETEITLSSLIRTAWHKVGGGANGVNAVQGNDIYTEGWVGIGYNDKTTGLANEKLRVNGSVSAVNSYYADYVFDAYFNGTSALKYDYNFKSLDAVDNFIKTNKHLPGITPISELTTTENGYAFNMSELSIQLLEKTEELYLHTIEQAKDINALQKENEELKNRLQVIEDLVKANLSK
ncbi:hypothetical protein [Myroides phaeus]|uniref:hypothetical protein n=1 Tax=Myroides phaeus TaxID=702745 RepID=UPI0013036F90|nr:hypothetical protein [Myroides phaeus]